MRIGVLLSTQSPESTPEHFVSKKHAEQFLSYYHNGKKAVVIISPKLLQIKANLTFGKLKSLFRSAANGEPLELPIRDWREPLLIHYPIADQRS